MNCADQYKITKDDGSPMYYNAMGNLCITDSYWDLLTYENIKNYVEQTRMINDNIERITQKSKKLYEEAAACEQFIMQTSTIMQQIESNRLRA